MYSFISGTVVCVDDGQIVIENHGIGYQLSVTATTLADAGHVGRNLQLWTYLQVKEDGITLFGFSTREEKDMFLRLLSISGIGPKMAQQILSGCDLKTLALCIATGDVKTLSKVKGLGKKTAERLVLELRDSVGGMELTGVAAAGDTGASGGLVEDAVAALSSLGFDRAAVLRVVSEVVKETQKLDEVVAIALRRM